jgi:hypothetical protein
MNTALEAASVQLNQQLPALLAAPIGALCALLWTQGTFARRLALWGVGCAASHYAAPIAARLLGITEAPAGFFLGLVSVAVIDKVFVVWRRIEVDSLLEAAVDRFFGVKWRQAKAEPSPEPAGRTLPHLPVPRPRFPVEESLEENDQVRQPYLVQDRLPQQQVRRNDPVRSGDLGSYPTLPMPTRVVTVGRRVYDSDYYRQQDD